MAALLYHGAEAQCPVLRAVPFGLAAALVIWCGWERRSYPSCLACSAFGEQAGGTAFSLPSRSAVIFLLTDYTRTLCEEAGADSLAWCVGLAGRCLVLAAAWPLLEEILQRIGEHDRMKELYTLLPGVTSGAVSGAKPGIAH